MKIKLFKDTKGGGQFTSKYMNFSLILWMLSNNSLFDWEILIEWNDRESIQCQLKLISQSISQLILR